MDVLLAIDCSLRFTNIALTSSEIKASVNADIGRKQAAELPLMVEEMLRCAKIEKREITHVGVTIGPGYFTGVRIGTTYAAAFAFGVGAKIVPVGALDSLLFGRREGSVCLVYAGKGRVYAAGGKIKRGEYATSEILGLIDENVRIFSDLPEKIENFPHSKIEKITPCAENVARLAWEKRLSAAISPLELRADWCKDPV